MAAANRLACLVLCGVWMQVSALSLGARALAGDALQAPQQPGPGQAPHAGATGSEVAKRLAGVWKAAEDRERSWNFRSTRCAWKLPSRNSDGVDSPIPCRI